jgi:inorganic triphosphatase YgiF
MMGKEIELKLEVPPQELRRLKGWRTLSRKGAGEQDLASVYFDTPKHKLGRNGISLRIRRNGEKRLQTVKSQGADGSFRRGEWESEIKGDVPDLRKVQGTALEPLLTKKLKHKLMPVFETRVRRTIAPVRRNGSRIEATSARFSNWPGNLENTSRSNWRSTANRSAATTSSTTSGSRRLVPIRSSFGTA